MSSVIVYYSRTGKTKLVADILSKEINADTVEIKDKTNRSGLIGLIKGARDTIKDNETQITPNNVDITPYDTIYIGSPVWANKVTPAIMKFIEDTDLENKKIVSFITLSHKTGITSLDEFNKQIEDKNGNIYKSFAILTKSNNNIEELTKEAINDLDD